MNRRGFLSKIGLGFGAALALVGVAEAKPKKKLQAAAGDIELPDGARIYSLDGSTEVDLMQWKSGPAAQYLGDEDYGTYVLPAYPGGSFGDSNNPWGIARIQTVEPDGEGNLGNGPSAAWRNVYFNLPTSDPHVVGQLWQDGVNIKVSTG